jgi:hypothetical protein
MTTMTKRRVAGAAVLMLLAAFNTFAQKAPAPGTHITVSKATGDDRAMFQNIQDAVNAAQPGQVIEILDESVYREQITIDGRDVSLWDGKNGGPVKAVKGGKNGITIRYVPASNRPFGNHARPTVEWLDTINHSPRATAEEGIPGDTLGSSGNFETCGALRIIRAQGVTIDGIKVSGGGAKPFGTAGVWSTNMFHGNAAIAIVVAGGAIIRNCDITNAYYGIAIKDRNTGGVFGNPNPGDKDLTIPLSGFGKAGGHLIEYNKIHGHMTGIFTESAWDLATTIRYNLIYNNIHDPSILKEGGKEIPGSSIAEGGAILFRDVMFTPFAIYNNTFFNNTRNLMGGWKAGVPHLVFNNIFSGDNTIRNGKANTMTLENYLPYRMHNSVFAASGELQSNKVYINQCRRAGVYDVTPPIPEISGQEISGITQVQVPPLPQPSTGISEVRCLPPLENMVVTTGGFIVPGTLLTNVAFEAAANLRWLETVKSVTGTEDLFVSTDPASSDFLRPKWDHPLIVEFIKNQGWTAIGMRNSDGTMADLGAISSTGRALPVVARVKPSNVVLISGTKADASFYVTVEGGGRLNDPKVSFLRWVAPLPTAEKTIVPTSAIREITPTNPAVRVNSNNLFSFTVSALPSVPKDSSQYGFFEVAVSGTDANGNTVTSDIGFLPYRNLKYTLEIEVWDDTGKVTRVTAGKTYTLKVTPKPSDDTYSKLGDVSYELLSDAAAFMYDANTNKALTSDKDVPKTGKTYQVYFTRAGEETIMGSGVSDINNTQRLVFLGTTDITVLPGDPAKVAFVNPISASQLGNAPATVINKGQDFPVEVEVQDRFGNAVNSPVSVTIVSDRTNIGDVGAPGNISTKSVNTSELGVASFTAKVTDGAPTGETFKMTANLTYNIAVLDTAKLRVGKSLDRLEIFYSDTGDGVSKYWVGYYNSDVKIEGVVPNWYAITVKVLAGDSVNTGRPDQYVYVSSDNPYLVFSAAGGGGAATGVFPLNDGVARFYVGAAPGAKASITNAGVSVLALKSNDPTDVDASMQEKWRYGINFEVPQSAVRYAVVFGDGHGRPDSVLVYIREGSGSFTGTPALGLPDKVTLAWGASGEIELVGGAVSSRGPLALHAGFTDADRPRGFTSIYLGRGVVKLYGLGNKDENEVDSGFPVYDGIGAVLGSGTEAGGSPSIVEYAGGYDTLFIKVSEQLRNVADSLTRGGKILYYRGSADPNDANGAVAAATGQLNVVGASMYNNTPGSYAEYLVAIDHAVPAGGLKEGDWIRFNPENGITDRGVGVDGGGDTLWYDNPPHRLNRWAKLKLIQPAPSMTAYYTASSVTGKPDYAYIVFSKLDTTWSWFKGGSIKFESGAAFTLDADAFGAGGAVTRRGADTLRIDLAKAYRESQNKIRTVGPMEFKLKWGEDKPWDQDEQPGTAQDRAAPVIAEAVTLKVGARKEDGSLEKDTLVVVYSERPGESAMGLPEPISIYMKGATGLLERCNPVTLGPGRGAEGSGDYYRVTYVADEKIDGLCGGRYPAEGDWARINVDAGFADVPGNAQKDSLNLLQPFVTKPSMAWDTKLIRNPFRGGGQDSLVVRLMSNATGVQLESMKLEARILVFDNLGVLAVDTLIKVEGKDEVSWTWNGTNRNGRMVGSGMYLMKAVCDTKTGGKEDPPRYSVSKPIGLFRGKK